MLVTIYNYINNNNNSNFNNSNNNNNNDYNNNNNINDGNTKTLFITKGGDSIIAMKSLPAYKHNSCINNYLKKYYLKYITKNINTSHYNT